MTDTSNEPLIPAHSRQAGRALLFLLFYSTLMFSLPFVAFFGTEHVLNEMHIEGFTNTAWSCFAAVVTVNVIIMAYAYHAYHETEYDEHGNEIKDDNKEPLNLKED